VIFRPHFASGIHLGPGDVTVHVDAARHHHQALGIDHTHRLYGQIARRLDHLSVGNPKIAHLAIDTVCRIVERSISNFDEVAGHCGWA